MNIVNMLNSRDLIFKMYIAYFTSSTYYFSRIVRIINQFYIFDIAFTKSSVSPNNIILTFFFYCPFYFKYSNMLVQMTL